MATHASPSLPFSGKQARKSIQCSEWFSVPKSLIRRLEHQDRPQEASCPGCMEIIREMELSSGGAVLPPRREHGGLAVPGEARRAAPSSIQGSPWA